MTLVEGWLVLTAFILMEPVTYLAHRFIFHGFGYGLHHSHHYPPGRIFERNDVYPLVSALLTMSVIAIGVFVPGCAALIPIGFGMTVYGVIYFFIHDLMIHRRMPWLKVKRARFRWHYLAHRVHHLYGGEPYGLLFPVIPRQLRKVIFKIRRGFLAHV